jgi:octaprenyl-diphosphate synthase
MERFGLALGYAFQIADDVLDYTADASTLGKNLGDDLAEGKATLPLIHALTRVDAASRARMAAAIERGDTGALPEIVSAIRASGSLDYSQYVARRYAEAAIAALETLPESPQLAALRGLAMYSVEREY